MVEHMGGGAETRSTKYLSELQPEMYAEINPRLANNLGIRKGDMIDHRVAGRIQDQGQGIYHTTC